MQEQLPRHLNNDIFALLLTRFYCLKIDHLIKHNGIKMRSRRVMNLYH